MPATTSRPPSPTRLMIRSRSSAAARFVNVTARIRHGGDVLDADQVGDPMGEDARLARAGAGEDQQRAVGRRDGARLLGVEGADDLAPRGPSRRGAGRRVRRRGRGGRVLASAGASRIQAGSSGTAAGASARSVKTVPEARWPPRRHRRASDRRFGVVGGAHPAIVGRPAHPAVPRPGRLSRGGLDLVGRRGRDRDRFVPLGRGPSTVRALPSACDRTAVTPARWYGRSFSTRR